MVALGVSARDLHISLFPKTKFDEAAGVPLLSNALSVLLFPIKVSPCHRTFLEGPPNLAWGPRESSFSLIAPLTFHFPSPSLFGVFCRICVTPALVLGQPASKVWARIVGCCTLCLLVLQNRLDNLSPNLRRRPWWVTSVSLSNPRTAPMCRRQRLAGYQERASPALGRTLFIVDSAGPRPSVDSLPNFTFPPC